MKTAAGRVVMFSVVTVTSEYGSGGAMIGSYVAETLGWKLLDGALIAGIANAAHVTTKTVMQYDEKVDSWWHRFNVGGLRSAAIFAGFAPEDAQFFDSESTAAIAHEIMLKAVEQGDCVIVGHGAQCLLQGREDVLNVFIYASCAERMKRARERAEPDQDVEELIRVTDRERADFVRTRYGSDWKNPHLYHMMLCSTAGIEQAGRMIVDAVERWSRHRDSG